MLLFNEGLIEILCSGHNDSSGKGEYAGPLERRAARRHRRAYQYCRRLPLGEDRRRERRDLGGALQREPADHVQRDQGRPSLYLEGRGGTWRRTRRERRRRRGQ